MGDFAPLGYTLAFLLFLGLFMPFVLGFFIDVNDVELSPLVSVLSDFVDDGISIFTFEVNPFSWLGDSLHEYFSDAVVYLGLLPDWLIAGILILSIVSIFYTAIKLLPTT